MEHERDLPTRLTALRLLHGVVAAVNAARGLNATLQAVVDGVVSSLGFEGAAVNLVRGDGDLEVAAVAGGDEVREALTGKVGSRESWDDLLGAAEVWGSLRFLSHLDETPPGLPTWVAKGRATRRLGAWHPHDALLAPLFTPDGELVGVLSLDMPKNGLRPGPWQRELLEMFAAQAAIAIDNARLRAEALRAVAQLETEQRALRASEESFRQAFENAPSGMAMSTLTDPSGRIVRANDALCRLLGYPESTLRRGSLDAVVHAEDRAVLEGRLLESGCHELRLVRSDGESVWVSLRASVIPSSAGEPHFLLTHVEDIEDRKRREQLLMYRASHDPLTGLPNRAELRARLDRMLVSGGPLAILFCDLDDFKGVNDRYGHPAGDAVLVEVALRLRAAVRDQDMVARVGGDEFVITADGISRTDAQELADRLSGAFVGAMTIESDEIVVGASFGVSWSHGGASAEELLCAADQEMYKHKRVRAKLRYRAG